MNKYQATWNDTRHTLGVDEIDNAHREFIAQVAALIAASDADFPPLFQALVAHTREHFIADAELIIHNAPFDVGFLNHEFSLLNREPVGTLAAGVVDTLRMARDLRPGKKNSLDALCTEFGVDNSGRQLHGALLDARLLADVYLELRGGRQPDLAMNAAVVVETETTEERSRVDRTRRAGSCRVGR